MCSPSTHIFLSQIRGDDFRHIQVGDGLHIRVLALCSHMSSATAAAPRTRLDHDLLHDLVDELEDLGLAFDVACCREQG